MLHMILTYLDGQLIHVRYHLTLLNNAVTLILVHLLLVKNYYAKIILLLPWIREGGLKYIGSLTLVK